MININMRCIEISIEYIGVYGPYPININMRCIEINHYQDIQRTQLGLTLT